MADELAYQSELCERLEKAIKNYKKIPKDRLTKSYLETRLQTLEELYIDFKKGHREVLISVPEEKRKSFTYFTEDKYNWFEELYTSHKSAIKETLIPYLEKSYQSTPVPSGGVPITSTHSEVILPRIQLPIFTGKYDEWQAFYDMFVSLIHSSDKLSAVQKLHYLKTSLSGEPANLLLNFATTEQNYDEAWKHLVKRYNNRRYNSNAVLKTLFNQKQITNESSSAIKQLLDTTSSCLKALKNMGIKTDTWDAIIVYLVVSKLDIESHKQWENLLSMTTGEMPTWSLLVNFLESRFRGLEMIDASKQPMKTSAAKVPTKTKSFHGAVQDDKKANEPVCKLCDGQHYLYQCKKFGEQSVQSRQEFIQSKGLCFNCLSSTHVVSKCRQSTCCKRCGRRHHTLLHFEREGSTGGCNTKAVNIQLKTNEKSPQASTSNAETRIVANFSKGEIQSYNVLLATAIIKAHSRNGLKYSIRALLDQGSQASFVAEATVQLLGLKRTSVNGVVSGLGDGQTRVKHMVSLRIESRYNPENTIQVHAYVLGSLTSLLPSDNLQSPDWLDLEDLQLADPQYTSPGKIHILLGAEVYSEILLNGMMKHSQGNLIAQNTVLGWVISGKVSNNSTSAQRDVISMHVHTRDDDFLKQFWEMEAEPNKIQKAFTKEEQKCEEFYEATTRRNEEGRFVVRLPFNEEDPACQYGESQTIATKKLWSLEKRLLKNQPLYTEYRKVLDEYRTLNHMSIVEEGVENSKAVYLPHHAVVREDKETTKVRVVFNASSKGVNGVSLNDNLLVGPKLQQDLRHLLMRWRIHPICIVADLVKMYRQVRVEEEDANYQRILWRPNPESPIQHYKLLTLTFGTACAPYLAVKTLQRLAEEEKHNFPTASTITKRDYYIDDLMTGCDSEDEAKVIYDEMNKLMNSGGFQLQKWSSNNARFLEHIDKDKHNCEPSIPIKADNMFKVLGIKWNKATDNFEYTVNLPETKNPITKRQVLSDIARLYDPIGWIAPVVISAKIIIQKIWKAHLDWDDQLTDDLLAEWLQYREELSQIKDIMIPRWLQCTQGCDVELHTFSDASRAAFAAAVYIRATDSQGNVHVSLVSAKTKVAPIEKEMTIPRLELCGATLGAKLISEISQVMKIPKTKLFAWTDSTVVLAWLKGGASRWTTFVSNRVSEILTILDFEQWGHVTSDMNPSDCASRGLRPAELQSHVLWWHGPHWLRERKVYNEEPEIPETHEEERIQSLVVTEDRKEDFVWKKFSNLTKMLKVISYCRRILNLRLPKEERQEKKTFITTKEMDETLHMCVKQVQEIEFGEEIRLLAQGKNVPKKSVLHTLYPILDQNGILRVGGRIDQAHVRYEKRHPIIIPAKSCLASLLIADAHDKTLHGGPQVMLNFLRSKYWILRVRDQVKKYYRRCVTCWRHSKSSSTQLMGQLPEVRLKPSKPFKSSGVDYAGPINIRFSPGRGAKSYKGYICLFVCMVTRAIHIEAVTDLTAKAFVAAFRRFTSRRGHCQDLFSDNGTNFVGADKLLRDMFNNAISEMPNEIAQALAMESTTWHFIPPYSPNFGGLWEAGIRCAKVHLKKVIGDSTLTYEELTTVLSQVEACLNSRPLNILSDDPNDPLPLTPGHFLIGEPLLNISDIDYSDCTVIGLDRWKLVQKMVNGFWKRWSKEYLVMLSQRYKWTTKKPEPDVNDIVIVRDDNVPPCKWILGKIVDKHAGPDNVTRVVTVKCKNGYIKRPLSKLCVLEK